MSGAVQQRRIVLHLRYGAAGRGPIQAAAELARSLGLALHGVFLEDDALAQLTALPFVREFRLASGAWERLDRQRIADERRAAVTEARRLLGETAATFGVAFLFDTVSGQPGALLPATSRQGDIIVVAQPRLPVEALAHATAGWLAAAHGCSASVMLVPQPPARRSGPVAAVICAGSDAALQTAARIAAASEDTLLLLVWGASELATAALDQAEAIGLPRLRVVVRSIGGVTPEDVLQGLGVGKERLVVLARGACGADDAAVSAHIATSRGVPVLVVEP